MALTVAAGVGHASAATLLLDGFGDGDRNNDGTPDLAPGASVGDAGDTGAAFWKAKGSTQIFTVVDDAAGLGSGLALEVDGNGVSSPTAVAHFTPTTLADGDRITLSFEARLTSVPSASDRRFRWGLFSSNSTSENDYRKSQDGGSTADNVNLWSGFIGRVDVGPGSPGVFSINQNNAGSLLNANEFLVGSDDLATALDDTTRHLLTLTLERDGDHMIVTSTFDAVALSKDTLSDQEDGGAIGAIPFTYDSIALGFNGFNGANFRIDNVTVEHSPIPEPASLAVLGLAGLAVFRRSR